MYRNLKFSWAHIFAFLALIVIGYISYVGLTYDMDDGFQKPALVMVGILVLLIVWFVGAQQLKGVDNGRNFKKCIWWERILLFTTPIIFVLAMLPFNHAMNVASKSEEIETTFKEAINNSTQLFSNYEGYAMNRVDAYETFLRTVKDNPDSQPTVYANIGFVDEANEADAAKNERKIEIEKSILLKQLTQNFDNLRTEANAWIELVNQRTSVWNIFLVGNLDEIEKAIRSWSDNLKNDYFSKKILNTEDRETQPFDGNNDYVGSIIASLDSLRGIYNPVEFSRSINPRTIVWGIILYLLLLFPYFIQGRNGVSTYTLFGRRFLDQGIDLSDNLKPSDTVDHKIKKAKKGGPRDQIVIEVPSAPTIEVSTISTNSEPIMETDNLTKEERHRRRQERREALRNKGNE